MSERGKGACHVMMRNRNIEIIQKSTKDLFQLMPVIVTCKVALSILTAVFSILNVRFLANIIETAGTILDGQPLYREFITNIAVYILCYAGIKASEIILYYIDNIWIVPKMEFFHHRLSVHLTEISLEATNLPRIQDMFWRAKDAVYQDRILNVFMSAFHIVPILVQLIGTMYVLGTYHLWLVGLAFISVFPSAAIIYWCGKKEYAFSKEQTKNQRMKGYLWRVLTTKESIRESKIYGFHTYVKKVFYDVHRKNYIARKKLSIKEDFWKVTADFCKYLLYIVAMFFAIHLVYENKIGIGAFSACIAVFSTMQGRATNFFAYFSQINSACNYAKDYYDFFQIDKENRGQTVLDEPIRIIDLKDVSYQYHNGDKMALHHIDLQIKEGELIVIVGENGSGKTTLSKLIMGLYKPTLGEITVNSFPLTTLDTAYYYRKFSIVIQNFEKYAISLKDNVVISDYLSSKADLEDLFHHNDLVSVKDRLGGYDAMLGIEFGDEELSGGEWQRVALARSMYKDSEIIVFDEPTSAIDPLQEYDLLNKFIEIAKQKTCIIISHRVGICKKADKIVVLHNGQIVETGNHHELLKNKSKYYELWRAQAQWYE